MRVDTTEMPTVELSPSGGLHVDPTALGSGETQLSVLVVDDNVEVRSMLAATLREAGYAVTEAIGPNQAREFVSARPFHAAVIDLVMPEVNGIDVLEGLRALPCGANMAAVLLNVLPGGRTREAVLERVARLGEAEVLYKPVTATTLLAALRRLVAA